MCVYVNMHKTKTHLQNLVGNTSPHKVICGPVTECI